MYASQVSRILSSLSIPIKVSTVDAFQGEEKPIIILSTVRTKSIGFAGDERRVNVAITRGKRHLIIVGNAGLLGKSRPWDRIVNLCEGRGNGVMRREEMLEIVGEGDLIDFEGTQEATSNHKEDKAELEMLESDKPVEEFKMIELKKRVEVPVDAFKEKEPEKRVGVPSVPVVTGLPSFDIPEDDEDLDCLEMNDFF
jgi:hypothetical protein